MTDVDMAQNLAPTESATDGSARSGDTGLIRDGALIVVGALGVSLVRRLGLLRGAWMRKTLGLPALEAIEALPAPDAQKILPAPDVAVAAPAPVRARNPVTTITVTRARIVRDQAGGGFMHLIEGTGGPYNSATPFAFAMPAGTDFPFEAGSVIEIVNPNLRDIRMISLAPFAGGIAMLVEPTAEQAARIASQTASKTAALQDALWRALPAGLSTLQRAEPRAPYVTVSCVLEGVPAPTREGAQPSPVAAVPGLPHAG